MARSLGVEPSLPEATDTINRRQAGRLAKIAQSQLPEGGCVGILGLSYKADTNVIEESQGVALAKSLLAAGASVIVYDPAALDNARSVLGDQPTFAASLQDCVQQADVLVIITPWPEFQNIRPEYLVRNGSRPHRPVILDCWRMFRPDQFDEVADYIALGLG
jgi:UDPglucose 6-dehydrogenase